MQLRNMAILQGLFAVTCLLVFSSASSSEKILGINYGRLGDNLPSPDQTIQLLRFTGFGHVKLYDSDPHILNLISAQNLHVSIMLPNSLIHPIASNPYQAHLWVDQNVVPHLPGTKIRFLLVGNEVLSINDTSLWLDLVPAMRNINHALRDRGIHNVKVGTPLAMDALDSTSPPSAAKFRADIAPHVVLPLLRFLNGTHSYFFLDAYPYLAWSADPGSISLDFALLGGNADSIKRVDSRSGLTYTNLLDEMLDAAHFAMRRLGFDGIRIAVSETGWPHAGDIDEPGANLQNAATYVRNLVRRAHEAMGTPARPGVEVPTFVFSLFDEDSKPGPGTERHWGLFSNSGRPNYEFDLTGTSSMNNESSQMGSSPYRGRIWCVAAENADEGELVQALEFSCTQGNGTCDELWPGESCYQPVSVAAHASYAFSSYWAKFRSAGASCYFNALAVQTITDPSHGTCQFPSVVL